MKIIAEAERFIDAPADRLYRYLAERLVAPRLLARVYREELRLLDRYSAVDADSPARVAAGAT